MSEPSESIEDSEITKVSPLSKLPDSPTGHYQLRSILELDFVWILKEIGHQGIIALARTCKYWMVHLQAEYRYALQIQRALHYGISPWTFYAAYRDIETMEIGIPNERFPRATLALNGRLDRLMALDATIAAAAERHPQTPLKPHYNAAQLLDPERYAYTKTQVSTSHLIKALLPKKYQLLRAFDFYGYTLALCFTGEYRPVSDASFNNNAVLVAHLHYNPLTTFYVHCIRGEIIQYARRVEWRYESLWRYVSHFDTRGIFLSPSGDVISYLRLERLLFVLPSDGQPSILHKIHDAEPVFSPIGAVASMLLQSEQVVGSVENNEPVDLVQVSWSYERRSQPRLSLWQYIFGTGLGYHLGDCYLALYKDTGLGSILYNSTYNEQEHLQQDSFRIWSWQENTDEDTVELRGWELRPRYGSSFCASIPEHFYAAISECGKLAIIANLSLGRGADHTRAIGRLLVRLEDGASTWQETPTTYIKSVSRDLRRAIVSDGAGDYLVMLQWPGNTVRTDDHVRIQVVHPREDSARLNQPIPAPRRNV